MIKSLALCGLVVGLARLQGQAPTTTPTRATYVGSERCNTCHAEIYGRWSKTRMADNGK